MQKRKITSISDKIDNDLCAFPVLETKKASRSGKYFRYKISSKPAKTITPIVNLNHLKKVSGCRTLILSVDLKRKEKINGNSDNNINTIRL